MLKVGDIVKIVKRSNSCNSLGDIGSIVQINNEIEFKVKVEGNSNSGNWHNASQLELVK